MKIKKEARMGRWVKWAVVGVPALFLLIQAVPYGRDHVDPPEVQEPVWTGAETRALAKRACFDCHSNETVWPAYSFVAPVSWMVQSDVDEGRQHLNFSDWKAGSRKGERPEKIREGFDKEEMPPFYYTFMHPKARLGDAELTRLEEGLLATTAAK